MAFGGQRISLACDNVFLFLGIVIGADLCRLPSFPEAQPRWEPHMMKTLFALLTLFVLTATAAAQNTPATALCRLLTVEGKVEVARSGTAVWTAGTTNQTLQNGDRVRTGARSRATIQMSDRSTLRVDALTTLEIRPPQAAGANAGFEMKSGASYFFNRERPGSIEFRTPLASGAIRGTEVHLLVG